MSRRLVPAVGVGLLGAVISILRLWLANTAAPTEVLWAEDGLFPLCVEKAGFLTCLVDPFAGYLLFVPRAVAGLVAVLPPTAWALATNVLAALLAGVVCALAFAWCRRSGLSAMASVLVGLLPVVLPLAGVEAINALGSAYMPLLFLATLVVALQSGLRPVRGWVGWATVVLLLVTALTIPLALLLVPVIVWQVIRGGVPGRVGLGWSVTVILGTLAQAVTALGAATPRPISVGAESLGSYFTTLPQTMATLVGLRDDVALDGGFTLPSVPGWLGPVVFVLVLVLAAWAAWCRADLVRGAGLMALAGLAFGLVPSVIGWANNRYFVVPLLLWSGAAIVAVDGPVRRWAVDGVRRSLVAVVVVGLGVTWAFALPASQWRATPAPPWTAEVERVAARCLADPGAVERPIFSPFWPPNWGDGLSEPTHPNLPCVVGFRWQ